MRVAFETLCRVAGRQAHNRVRNGHEPAVNDPCRIADQFDGIGTLDAAVDGGLDRRDDQRAVQKPEPRTGAAFVRDFGCVLLETGPCIR